MKLVRESIIFNKFIGSKKSLSISEELVHQYIGEWSHSNIEIYKNPKSIKRMGSDNRAISDINGNFWIADDSDTTHDEIMKELFKIKEVQYDKYYKGEIEFPSVIPTLILVGWQRRDDIFYLAEGYDDNDFQIFDDQFRVFVIAVKRKNPSLNFSIE